jgi:NAD(P)-dependent dehydrogenase (short-subunit alcohol dehydrogenase family)
MGERLNGKVAVVLGASDRRGMGYATAKRFAEEGARLVLGARRGDAVKEIAGELGAVGLACDVTKEADLAALAKAAVDTHGGLDIAVNYAGIYTMAGPITEMAAEAFREYSDVHFVGTGLFIKHMALAMRDGGSIVMTSSLTVLLQALGASAYAGSKAGGDIVMKIAANELGARGIRVNAVAPGMTKSGMTEGSFAMEAVQKAFLREIPLGRFPTVTDIANAALWLASDECLATGQIIDLTAGQSMRRIPNADEFV